MRNLLLAATSAALLHFASGVATPVFAQGTTAVAPAESRIAKNRRARVVFKSGVTQEFLWVGVSTDAFTLLRAAYWRHLENQGPNRYHATGPDGWQISISFADVSAVTTWSD